MQRKTSWQTLFSGQAQVPQKSWKIKIFQCSEEFQGKLYFSGHAQVVQNSEWLKRYIYSIQWIQGSLCFSGQATSCSKVLKDKKYFNTVKNFRATLFFRERKLFKNLNDKKSVTAVRGGKEGSSSPSVIMKCAKRIRDPKKQLEWKFVHSCWKGSIIVWF